MPRTNTMTSQIHSHMKRILILFSIIVAVTSCRTTRSVEREEHTESVSVTHDTVYSASYRDRIVTDTLHDSVYIREVVNIEGKTVYLEKNTSRDHKAQTVIKHDTVYIRVNDSASVDKSVSEVTVTEKKNTSLVAVPYIVFGILVCIAIKIYIYFRLRKL